MSRREFPAKVKVAAYERSRGRCECCTALLAVGKFHYDHRVPDALGGVPVLSNCEVLCLACHGAKTAGGDVPRIAKAKREQIAHIGAKARTRSPLPGSRDSKWKRKLDGTVVPR